MGELALDGGIPVEGQIVPVDGTDYTMVLGRIVRFHVREGLLRENGEIDVARMRPVARLGGVEYAAIGPVFAMRPPRVPPGHGSPR